MFSSIMLMMGELPAQQAQALQAAHWQAAVGGFVQVRLVPMDFAVVQPQLAKAVKVVKVGVDAVQHS